MSRFPEVRGDRELRRALEPSPSSVERIVRSALASGRQLERPATDRRPWVARLLPPAVVGGLAGGLFLALVILSPQRPAGSPELGADPEPRRITFVGSGRALLVTPSTQAGRPPTPTVGTPSHGSSGSILIVRRRDPS